LKVKDVIKLLEKNGWEFVRHKGSHKIYRHPDKQGIVVIPDHGLNKDLAKGTENSILKQAGLQ